MPTFSASDELVSFAAALNGQYDIEREIGRGGMGVVYLARDLRLDRMVAIKTLPPSLANDESVRERFLREARTAARLNHPNNVPRHRADELGGQGYFVRAFIDADTLAGRLASGPLSPRDAVPILRDVAAALGYAHRHGVVHRDVKTENIVLDTVTGRAMVTDFGIARVAAATPLTATGQVLGTVYYLSPEQVADANVDARSDIYALGVVGFAMLSGRFPFDGALASAVLISHVVMPAPALGSVAPHVPSRLAAIIDRCLAKNPADRFQSCAELDAALESVRAEANGVTMAPARTASPLIGDTEAQEILRRAAELAITGARQPVSVKPRNPVDDANRLEGFKTSILREAAAEAGIHEQHMSQALAEHGLRGTPTRNPPRADLRPARALHDLSTRGLVESNDACYEMVVEGEMPLDDHDLLVAIARSHFPDGGTASTVGRALSWKGATTNRRTLEVSVQPRGGRTTIRVRDAFQPIVQSMWVGSIAVIGLLGGGLISSSIGGGPVFLTIFGLSGVLASIAAKGYASGREADARALIEKLGAQVELSVANAKRP